MRHDATRYAMAATLLVVLSACGGAASGTASATPPSPRSSVATATTAAGAASSANRSATTAGEASSATVKGPTTTSGARASSTTPAITFSGTIAITGMDQVSGSFTDVKAGVTYGTCSAWANGSNRLGFGMPLPRAPVNGTPITMILSLNYKGPGTYSKSSDLNLFSLTAGRDEFGDPNSFSVQVNPDGSGTATLTDARSTTSTSPSAKVTVNEKWTCRAA